MPPQRRPKSGSRPAGGLSADAAPEGGPLRAGDKVWVFFRITREAPDNWYLAAPDTAAGMFRPRLGMAEGWVPAVVCHDHDAAGGFPVQVRHVWTRYYNSKGLMLDPTDEENMLDQFARCDVVPRTEDDSQLVRTAVRPKLGVLAVRWGGRELSSNSQWGSTGSSISESYLRSFIQLGLRKACGLGNDYEVWIAYIEDITDLHKLRDCAHLAVGGCHPLQRCQLLRGFYQL